MKQGFWQGRCARLDVNQLSGTHSSDQESSTRTHSSHQESSTRTHSSDQESSTRTHSSDQESSTRTLSSDQESSTLKALVGYLTRCLDVLMCVTQLAQRRHKRLILLLQILCQHKVWDAIEEGAFGKSVRGVVPASNKCEKPRLACSC
jgi:hypothetical protein